MATDPKAATAPAPEKLSYRVLSELHHDGQRYVEGDLVALTSAQAKPLIAADVVTAGAVEG